MAGNNLQAIEAGNALIRLSMNDVDIVNGFKNINKAATFTMRDMKGLVGAMAGVSAAIVAPFAIGIRHMQTWGAQIFLVANRVDMAAGKIAALADIAEKVGTSYSALEIGLKTLGERKIQALAGSGETMAALKQLGADPQTFMSQSVEENLLMFADLIRDVGDASMQSGLALRIFGESGNQLLPLLRMGSEELKKVLESGRYNTGAIMESFEVSRDIKDLTQAFRGLTMTLASLVTPAFRMIIRGLTLFVDWLNQLIQSMGIVAPFLAAFAFTVVGLTISLGALTAIIAAMPALIWLKTAAVSALNVALGFTVALSGTLLGLFAGLILIVSAFLAVITALAFHHGYWASEAETQVGKIIDGLIVVRDLFIAIADGISKLGTVGLVFAAIKKSLGEFGIEIIGPLDAFKAVTDDMAEGLAEVGDGLFGMNKGMSTISVGSAGAYASSQTLGPNSLAMTNQLLEQIKDNTEVFKGNKWIGLSPYVGKVT